MRGASSRKLILEIGWLAAVEADDDRGTHRSSVSATVDLELVCGHRAKNFLTAVTKSAYTPIGTWPMFAMRKISFANFPWPA
jgi:hypothetical protein